MEYIDWLGFDWRDFRTVIVSETLNGQIYTTVFAVTGPRDLVQRLRTAHDKRKERGGDDDWIMQTG